MISCADVRGGLVAGLRGELSVREAADAAEHLAACDVCRAERDALRRTLSLVLAHAEPEVSADARLRLSSAIDAELRARPVRRRRPVVLVPAALAAGALVAWLLPESVAPRGPEDELTARAVASAEMPDRSAGGGLTAQSAGAAERGLAWLLARQDPRGTWTPAQGAAAEPVAAATASALLAFAADGQSPAHGPNAAALSRARDRLVELVAAGFSSEADEKPVYAQALAVRALTAVWRLDRDSMRPAARRELREVLLGAGRSLVAAQGGDGGFGYAPRSHRSDSSCTLFAVAALTDLRSAELVDATGAIARAGRYLDALRADDGGLAYAHPGDRSSTPALTAALLALDGEFGPSSRPEPGLLSSIEKSMTGERDALLAWTGAAALARHGRPLEAPVRGLLARQREDGAWPAQGDLRCEAAGDAVTTAFGVLALAHAYSR